MSDDADDKPDNVVTIHFGAGGETRIKDASFDKRHCRHVRMLIDEENRSISCEVCEKPLDPFQICLDYARRERNWRHYETEEHKTRKKISELEAEEKKLKARIRNAKRKDADLAVEAERKRHSEQHYRTHANARSIVELAERIMRAHDGEPQPAGSLIPWNPRAADD